jgi:hypothetical protein
LVFLIASFRWNFFTPTGPCAELGQQHLDGMFNSIVGSKCDITSLIHWDVQWHWMSMLTALVFLSMIYIKIHTHLKWEEDEEKKIY